MAGHQFHGRDASGTSHPEACPIQKLLEKADLPDIRFHDLRHSAATLLLSLGVHSKVVQEALGHTQISMTMDIYSHVLPSMQQDAVSRLNSLLLRREDGPVGKDG